MSAGPRRHELDATARRGELSDEHHPLGYRGRARHVPEPTQTARSAPPVARAASARWPPPSAIRPRPTPRCRVSPPEQPQTPQKSQSLVFPRRPRLFVVFDTVCFQTSGFFTLSNLWSTREVRSRGTGYAVGAVDRIGSTTLPSERELLLVFPGVEESFPQRFSLRRHRQDEQVLHETRSRWFDGGTLITFVTVLWPVAPGTDPRTRTVLDGLGRWAGHHPLPP